VAHRKVQLYKYLLLDSGWRYCRAAFYENNRIKPHVVLTPQGEVTLKDGQYYLGFARKWEPAGNGAVRYRKGIPRRRTEKGNSLRPVGTSRRHRLHVASKFLRPEGVETLQDSGLLAALRDTTSNPIVDLRFEPTHRPSPKRDWRWKLPFGNPQVNRRARKPGTFFHRLKSENQVGHLRNRFLSFAMEITEISDQSNALHRGFCDPP